MKTFPEIAKWAFSIVAIFLLSCCGKRATALQETSSNQPRDSSGKVSDASVEKPDGITHQQQNRQTSPPNSKDDPNLVNSEKLVDLNTLLMRRMVDYGVYYVCMVERKLKPSDFGFSDAVYHDRIYQITVIEFSNWEYLLRNAAGEPIPSKGSFGFADVAIPQIKVEQCILPSSEGRTTAFDDASNKYKPYYDLGFLHSGTDKTGILVTSTMGFESSGKNVLLLKVGDAQKVETKDGFTKSVSVYYEQEMVPQKENALVELWKKLDQAERKFYGHK